MYGLIFIDDREGVARGRARALRLCGRWLWPLSARASRSKKPMKKAYKQSPAAVKKWVDEIHFVITACAKVGEPRTNRSARPACAREGHGATTMDAPSQRPHLGFSGTQGPLEISPI